MVVTNSIRICEGLLAVERRDLTVLLTGGMRTPSDALVGPLAVAALASLHLDQVFMGVHGMSLHAGFTTPNMLEAETNKAFANAAEQLVVLADHTKWNTVGLASIAPLSSADIVVTDRHLDAAARDVLAARSATWCSCECFDDIASGYAGRGVIAPSLHAGSLAPGLGPHGRGPRFGRVPRTRTPFDRRGSTVATVTFDQATRLYAGADRPAVCALDLQVQDGEFMVLVGPRDAARGPRCGCWPGWSVRRGLHPHRRSGRHDAAAEGPRHRDGLPELRPVPAHDRRREHRLPPEIAKVPKDEIAALGRRGRRAARPRSSSWTASRPRLSGGQRQRVAMGRAIVRQP